MKDFRLVTWAASLIAVFNACSALSLGVVLAQSAVSPPIVLGPSANRVTAADIAQIAALTAASTSRPWVLVSSGPPFVPSMPWYIVVFLTPDHVTPAVRRGKVITVKTTSPAHEAYDNVREWVLDRTAEYGQVPVYSWDVARVTDGRDLNRPFRIHGDISDEDLSGLVNFVRTSPADPSRRQTSEAARSVVEGKWPIGIVVRQNDGSVAVSLLDDNPDEKHGQRVILRGNGTRWVVVSVNYWVAD